MADQAKPQALTLEVEIKGTAAVVRSHGRLAGCTIELINLGKQVRQLLGMTNLLSVFTVIGEHNIKL